MHILFLTDNFPPEVNAPASRTFEHCREWVRAGHDVTVITCAPNFPKGRVFEGYRNRLWQSEMREGIKVVRVWTYITANEGFLRRTLDYNSFMVAGYLAALFVRRVDVVIGTSPHFFTACAAWMTGSSKRVPWVFELRDLWPESIRVVGAVENERVIALLERVELFLYRQASLIVSVTHSFKETLVGRGIDPDKIQVVTNGVDSSQFSPRPKDAELIDQYGLTNKVVAGYIGTHGLAHALDTVLDAARILANDLDGDKYRIVLLGDGANKAALEERARREAIGNVIFIDSVPKADVARYWSILDIAIIHLKKTDLFTTVIPSKLFECMGMGIPVAHGVAGESAAIVEKEGVGYCFEPENAEALADAIRNLSDDDALYEKMKTAGPKAAASYDRKAMAANMLAMIVQLNGTE